MTYKALDVAKWFLAYNERLKEEYGTDPITNIKLQCFLYYAQGFYYGMTDRLLFNEKLIAYKYGFAVREVYSNYKAAGNNGLVSPQGIMTKFYADDEEILKQVYKEFSIYSAGKLVKMVKNEQPYNCCNKGDALNLGILKVFFYNQYLRMD